MLKQKTVFVTGSSRGIGKEVAIAFAKAGANIVLNARSQVSEDLVNDIKSYGVEVLVLLGDVSSFTESKEMIEAAKAHFGTLDVLVNNAGITKDQLLIRMSEEDFDTVNDINLKGTFNMCRHAVPIFLKQKSGSIINMSSVVGEMGNIGQVNYVSSKAGVIGLTKAIAREVGARGITCNAITPGFIETDMTDELSETVKETMLANIPLKRFGQAEDVAQAAVFLAQAKYVTGHVLSVNGGLYI